MIKKRLDKNLYRIKRHDKKQLENQLRAELKIIIASYKTADEQYNLAKEAAQFAKLAYEQSLHRQQLETAEGYLSKKCCC